MKEKYEKYFQAKEEFEQLQRAEFERLYKKIDAVVEEWLSEIPPGPPREYFRNESGNAVAQWQLYKARSSKVRT